MKRLISLGDRLAMWAFLRVLQYWHWRTGRPAIVTMCSPELASMEFRAEETRH